MRTIVSALVLALCTCTATAQVYNRSTFNTLRFTPGLGQTGQQSEIVFDDVFVPLTLMAGLPQLRVNQVSVTIARSAFAPPTTVNVFWAPFMGTSYNTAAALGAPQFIDSVSFPANGATPTNQGVSLFNPAGMFTFTPNTSVAGASGFAGYFIGVQFAGSSPTSTLNGWRLTNVGATDIGFNFTDRYMIHDPTINLNRGPFTFNPSLAMFSITVFATPVPAPAAAGLLVLGVGVASRRRR